MVQDTGQDTPGYGSKIRRPKIAPRYGRVWSIYHPRYQPGYTPARYRKTPPKWECDMAEDGFSRCSSVTFKSTQMSQSVFLSGAMISTPQASSDGTYVLQCYAPPAISTYSCCSHTDRYSRARDTLLLSIVYTFFFSEIGAFFF